MQSQSLMNPSKALSLNPMAVRWAAQQSLDDWALRKCGGGLVPVLYTEAEWWNHFPSGWGGKKYEPSVA